MNTSGESGEVPVLLENIMLIWADTSLNVNDSTAGRDILNKYYLDILKARVPVEDVSNSKLRKLGIADSSSGSGFDVVSCQFSIHYFFENEKTLSTFLMNVSENLRVVNLLELASMEIAYLMHFVAAKQLRDLVKINYSGRLQRNMTLA